MCSIPGQQPYGESKQHPSPLGPCAGVFLSGQQPNGSRSHGAQSADVHAGLAVACSSPIRVSTPLGAAAAVFLSSFFFGFAVVVGLGVVVVVVIIGHPEFFKQKEMKEKMNFVWMLF